MSDAQQFEVGLTGWRRVVAAGGHSLRGLRAAWCNEAAFRQELCLLVPLAPLALWLGENGMQRAALLASCMLVLITELLNSAVETVVDRVGLEWNELSGRAKDIGSAAVLVALLQVPIVWGLIAWDRFN